MEIFGILNLTSDSCYDYYPSMDGAIKRALQMEAEGADFIDVGGESTRPGAKEVPEEEELKRVIPVIKELKKCLKIPISIDTYKPKVAKAALDAGACFVNDISGLCNPEMIKIVSDYKVKACIMHMQGTPRTMQINPQYPKGIVPELLEWFQRKIDILPFDHIVLDPGIGFGKTPEQNVEILRSLPAFKALGFPLFLGLSRKSFMMHYIKKPREKLLPATLAVASFAALQKVDILRVHDVGSHRDAFTILDGILK